MVAFYAAAFVAVAYYTRARLRRIEGALAGGAVGGAVGVLALALGERMGWWEVPKGGSSEFEFLLWLALAVSMAPVYLITWRVARRFGTRGLAVFAAGSALIGPPRDYSIAAMFPGWISYAPGLLPVVAVGSIYALLVIVGHGGMRLAAGPARVDSLARTP